MGTVQGTNKKVGKCIKHVELDSSEGGLASPAPNLSLFYRSSMLSVKGRFVCPSAWTRRSDIETEGRNSFNSATYPRRSAFLFVLIRDVMSSRADFLSPRMGKRRSAKGKGTQGVRLSERKPDLSLEVRETGGGE